MVWDCSIVIPAYNCGNKIENCLASILEVNATDRNIEVIIVNDGSTDDTALISEQWEEKYSSVKVLHKENGGVSSARNLGIKHASGRYLFFVDADDEIHRDVLDEMIEENDKAAVDLIVADFEEVDEKGKKRYVTSGLKTGILNREYIEKNIFTRYVKGENDCLANVWNKLFKLSLVKQNDLLFDENRTHGEDWAFCVRYFEVISNCMSIHKSVYKYKIDGTQHYAKYSTRLAYSLIDGHALMETINKKYRCVEEGSEEYCWFKRRFLNQIIKYLELDNCQTKEKISFLRAKEVRNCFQYLCNLNREKLECLGFSRKDKIAFILMRSGFFRIPLRILLR